MNTPANDRTNILDQAFPSDPERRLTDIFFNVSAPNRSILNGLDTTNSNIVLTIVEGAKKD